MGARRPKPGTETQCGTTSSEYPDSSILGRISGAYAKANLPRALPKSFRNELRFRAWGAEVDGDKGTVSAPLKARRDLWVILRTLNNLGYVSHDCLGMILGHVCHVFQYRRELYSLLHHSYKFQSQLPKQGWHRLPAHISDELFSIMLHLPLAVCNMRRKLYTSLVATDATPTSGGSCRARVSKALARTLFAHSVRKGGSVRMDGSERPGCEEKGSLQCPCLTALP